jgi:hypothetical protein
LEGIEERLLTEQIARRIETPSCRSSKRWPMAMTSFPAVAPSSSTSPETAFPFTGSPAIRWRSRSRSTAEEKRAEAKSSFEQWYQVV